MSEKDIRPSKVRNLRGLDISLLWIGAGISIAEIWAGNYLAPALPLLIALLVNIVGHLIGNTFMGAVAYAGSKTGVPTMVLTRGAFGIKGSYLISFLNYLQLIGWTAVMIIITARAIDSVLTSIGSFSNYFFWIVLVGLGSTLWALVGPKGWKWLHRVSVTMLLILAIWMAFIAVQASGPGILSYEPTWDISVAEGVDIVAAMPVSWAPLVADYGRFVGSPTGAFAGTYMGYFLASGLFYAIGSITNAGIGASDPISLMVSMGLGIPALVIVIFSSLTTTFLDVYSAGVSLKNILPKADLMKQIAIAGGIGTLLALVFPMESYEWFLLWIGATFFPSFGILITDYFLVKRGYDVEQLFKEGGEYWYRGGFSPLAVACWAVGFLAYVILIHSPAYSYIGATIPSIVLTVALYFSLAKLTHRVRAGKLG